MIFKSIDFWICLKSLQRSLHWQHLSPFFFCSYFHDICTAVLSYSCDTHFGYWIFLFPAWTWRHFCTTHQQMRTFLTCWRSSLWISCWKAMVVLSRNFINSYWAINIVFRLIPHISSGWLLTSLNLQHNLSWNWIT